MGDEFGTRTAKTWSVRRFLCKILCEWRNSKPLQISKSRFMISRGDRVYIMRQSLEKRCSAPLEVVKNFVLRDTGASFVGNVVQIAESKKRSAYERDTWLRSGVMVGSQERLSPGKRKDATVTSHRQRGGKRGVRHGNYLLNVGARWVCWKAR